MFESWLTYNLERRYPYRWLTPVVIVGGAISLTLLSLLNYSSSGFIPVTKYLPNPNQTDVQTGIDSKLPSFLRSKLDTQCQPASIPLRVDIYTTNTALRYQITGVRTADGQLQPSLIYMNNTFEQCLVQSVAIDLDSHGRNAAQIARASWGAQVRAAITCQIGSTAVNLTTIWDAVPDTVPLSTTSFFDSYRFFAQDRQKKTGLYWGESLLYNFRGQLLHAQPSWQSVIKGVIVVMPGENTNDIMSRNYYRMEWRLIGDSSVLYNDDEQIDQDTYRDFWISADNLAKTFQSIILTDLGQSHDHQPNFLADPEQLQNFTTQLHDYDGVGYGLNPDLTTGEFKDSPEYKNGSEQLAVSPSTLSMRYVCTVAQRKPLGSLFVAILIANLVFMKAIWFLFKFTIGIFMKRQSYRHKVNWCEGCLQDMKAESLPLTSPEGRHSRADSICEVRSVDEAHDPSEIRLLENGVV